MNNLEFKNVSKEYIQGHEKLEILQNITFNAEEGRLTSIMGASGSGKSTLLHIAGLIDRPSQGEVIVCGTSTKNLSEKKKDILRLEHIGFVYQYHHLLKNFSCAENIALPQLILGKTKKVAYANAEKLIERLGLSHIKKNYPSEMSGGERQRTAIARALVNNPRLLLADEPTGDLDPANAKEVIELFIETAREYKTSLIIVTHDLTVAQKTDIFYLLQDKELKYGTIYT